MSFERKERYPRENCGVCGKELRHSWRQLFINNSVKSVCLKCYSKKLLESRPKPKTNNLRSC